MKATCPNCSSSYRVADEKVPEGGAQIKCPKCNTLFVVRRQQAPTQPPQAPQTAQPPAQEPAAPPPEPLAEQAAQAPAAPQPEQAAHAHSTPLDEITGEQAVATPQPEQKISSPTPNLDALDGEGYVSAAGKSDVPTEGDAAPSAPPRARGVSAIRAQSGAKAGAGLLESYRVRTSRGLTYDFSTREAMLRWLGEREELDGCEVAEPGGEWVPADSLMDIGTPQARGTAEMVALVPGSPAGEQAAPPMAMAPPVATRPARLKSENAGWLLWALVLILLVGNLAVAAGTLTRYGVIDLSPYLPLDRVGVVFPAEGEGRGDQAGKIETVAEDAEKVYRKALARGRRSLRARKFSRAALEFNRAVSVHPGSPEALKGLARAYKGLGDHDRAEAVLKKLRSIEGG